MKTDGTGAPLDDAALYYVQDDRPGATVGNCISFWRPDGAGYTCNLDDAGLYTGRRCRTLRDSDVPWPCAIVQAASLRHVDHQRLPHRT